MKVLAIIAAAGLASAATTTKPPAEKVTYTGYLDPAKSSAIMSDIGSYSVSWKKTNSAALADITKALKGGIPEATGSNIYDYFTDVNKYAAGTATELKDLPSNVKSEIQAYFTGVQGVIDEQVQPNAAAGVNGPVAAAAAAIVGVGAGMLLL